jgi:hypothetical protein
MSTITYGMRSATQKNDNVGQSPFVRQPACSYRALAVAVYRAIAQLTEPTRLGIGTGIILTRSAQRPPQFICWHSIPSGKHAVVESRWDIIPSPSLLDLDVPISVHPAPDILNFRFCSCGCNRDRTRVLLPDYSVSNYHDFHLHDVDVLSHPLRILVRMLYMNGFAVLGL